MFVFIKVSFLFDIAVMRHLWIVRVL